MYDSYWDKAYKKAEEYYKQHGDLNIMHDYVTEDGFGLGYWVYKQKQNFKNGRLSIEKIERLNRIGMNYELLRNRIPWDEAYQLVKEYCEEHDDINELSSYVVNGINIGKWLYFQRRYYRIGTLTAEREQLLRDLGIDLDKKRLYWNDKYQIAKDYYLKHGNLDIEEDYVTEDGFELGYWISSQQEAYKYKKLPSLYARMLLDIGVTLKEGKNLKSWDEAYEVARDFYNKNHHLNVTRNYVTEDGFKLGKWIASRKYEYSCGKLSQERIKKLKGIGFNFDKRFMRLDWEASYQKVKEYYLKYGNCNIDKNYVTEDGYNLGKWLRNQRIYFTANTLPEEKAELLRDLGIDLYSPEVIWDKNYAKAKEYYEEHGDLKVPKKYQTEDGFKLGNWVNKMRCCYKKGTLSDEQINKLNEINMRFGKVSEFLWDKNYELAKDYFSGQEDNIDVKTKRRILSWLKKQIELQEANSLPEDKEQKYNEIIELYKQYMAKNKNLAKNENSDAETDVSFLIVRLCEKLGIDSNKNKNILCKISYADFRRRLLILEKNNIPYLKGDGTLNEIFKLSNEEIDNNDYVGYLNGQLLKRIKKKK